MVGPGSEVLWEACRAAQHPVVDITQAAVVVLRHSQGYIQRRQTRAAREDRPCRVSEPVAPSHRGAGRSPPRGRPRAPGE